MQVIISFYFKNKKYVYKAAREYHQTSKKNWIERYLRESGTLSWSSFFAVSETIRHTESRKFHLQVSQKR